MHANMSAEVDDIEYDVAPEKDTPPAVNVVRVEEGVSSR